MGPDRRARADPALFADHPLGNGGRSPRKGSFCAADRGRALDHDLLLHGDQPVDGDGVGPGGGHPVAARVLRRIGDDDGSDLSRHADGDRSLFAPTVTGTGFEADYAALVALYRAGRHDVVVERGGVLARSHPGRAALFNLIGASLAGLGRHDEAVEAYSNALAIEPESADAVNNLGAALRHLGRIEAAVQCHRRALAIRPDHAAAFNNLGTALRELGREDEAITAFRRAAEVRPDLFEAHLNLGNMLVQAGRREEAVACFDRALRLRPGDGYARAQKL
ncbi:MAG: tetratricopeptide repeat protein, partial [Rhizorhabdus sp.]